MEKFNLQNGDSNCSSDTDSQDDPNHFLLELFLPNGQSQSKSRGGPAKSDTDILAREESRVSIKEGSKNAKNNGR